MKCLRKLIFIKLIIFALFLLRSSTAFSCSAGCQCSPQDLPNTAVCSSIDLEVIPNGLPPSLSKLGLENNRIHSVETTLRYYSRLTHLDLSDNKISKLQRGCFSDSRQLAFLNLSDNHISHLESHSFMGLFNLVEIDLSHNYLENIPNDLFWKSYQLEIVYLSHNKLKMLPANLFQKSPKISDLKISDNVLEKVPTETLKYLSHLSELDISANSLQTLEPYSFPPSMSGMLKLDLSSCEIRIIPEKAFVHLDHLHTLNLENNLLEIIPTAALSLLKSLRNLQLGLNNFDTLREALPLSNLESFGLKGCKSGSELHLNDVVFARTPLLKKIDITGCSGLTEIKSRLFAELPYLESLNLHGNGIRSVDESAADWISLHHFDLSSNPFVCDCSLKWLNDLYAKRTELQSPRCSQPLDLQGKLLGQVREKEWECDVTKDKEFLYIFGIIAAVLLSIGGLVAVLWFLNLKQRCRKSHQRHLSVKERFPKLRKPVKKSDITVVPRKVENSSQYFDVIVEDEHSHVYEELPLGPTASNFPDVKISEI